MTRFRFLVLLLVGVVLVGVSEGRSDDKADVTGTKPLITLHGRNSKIKKPKLVRITTAEAWRALWLEHQTGSAMPADVPGDLESADLDFEKVMVIAVFEGEGSNCRGYSSHSVNVVEGRIRVRVLAHTYQSGIDTPDTRAWGILVLLRSNKEVVLEHDVRSLLADPPKWKEWTRFPSLEEKKR